MLRRIKRNQDFYRVCVLDFLLTRLASCRAKHMIESHAFACVIAEAESWTREKMSSAALPPTIRLEASEARGFVVSIAVNCSQEPQKKLQQQEEERERGTSASVVHVGGNGDVGRSASAVSLHAAMVRPGESFYFFEQPLSSPTDSGTGSDFDGSTPLAKRRQLRGAADDEEDDSISCDSLNSSELSELSDTISESIKVLKIAPVAPPPASPVVVVAPYGKPLIVGAQPRRRHEDDSYLEFHLNEHDEKPPVKGDEDTFAGVRDVLSERSAIRSAKGTVRGVKNRVRAGIATFLQIEDNKVSPKCLFLFWSFLNSGHEMKNIGFF